MSKEFLKIFAITFLAFVMLYMLVDFFEKIDDFIETKTTEHALTYFTYKVPFVGVQMAPMAVLMCTIITLGIFSKSHEIIAMKANGISLFQIGTPLITIALVITAISFMTSEFIVPSTTRKVNAIWRTHVKKKPSELIYKHEQLWYRGENVIYNIRNFNSRTKTLEGVIINQFDTDFRLIRRIQAHSATWEKDYWFFYNGIVKEKDHNGSSYKIIPFKEKIFNLAETPNDFNKVVKYSNEMGFRELREYAKKIRNEGYDACQYLVDMHIKLSFPFICVIMGLIGIPLALRKEKGVGIAVGIGISLVIILLYLVTFVIARTLGYSDVFPPIVAAWFANILFGSIGLFLFLNTKQ